MTILLYLAIFDRMKDEQISAQQLYEQLYEETLRRAKIRGDSKLPDETEVFKVLVAGARAAVANGEAPPEFLDELAEVKPLCIQEIEERLKEKQQERKIIMV